MLLSVAVATNHKHVGSVDVKQEGNAGKVDCQKTQREESEKVKKYIND